MVQTVKGISAGRTAGDETRRRLGSLTPQLWLWVLVFYCFADLTTSAIGLSVDGIGEIGPVASILYNQLGFLAMVPLKFVVLAVAYAWWEVLPYPHNVGIPLGLSVVGVLVTAWNLAILLTVL